MSRIGQAGRWILCGAAIVAAPSFCSAQSVERSGGAKISAPAAPDVADPFVNAGTTNGVEAIPTPIMTSSGHVAEVGPAMKPLMTVKPPVAAGLQSIVPSPSPAAATNVIDAGKLVPLSSPTVVVPNAVSPLPAKPQAVREPTPDDKLTEAAPAGLKPINPAAISRESVTLPTVTAATKAKPVAVKKPAPKAKAVEKPSEQIAPAVNFSFPQPVIPLESALRKFFKWSASRL